MMPLITTRRAKRRRLDSMNNDSAAASTAANTAVSTASSATAVAAATAATNAATNAAVDATVAAADRAADAAADLVAPIGAQLPRHLACADRYTELDAALLRRPADFFARHRDAPAHFTAAATRALFSPAQQQQLDALFAPGWQSDAASPLHALVGSCRASSAHRTQACDEYAARDASVGAFVRKAQRGKQLVVSDVPLGRLPAALAGELVRGPALFQHANMLQVVPQSVAMPEQYHALCYAIFATGQRQARSPAHLACETRSVLSLRVPHHYVFSLSLRTRWCACCVPSACRAVDRRLVHRPARRLLRCRRLLVSGERREAVACGAA